MGRLRVGSLFSGIGGIELGLERAGMHVKWQVENDDYCRRVLTKHWPDVPKYGDIRELTGDELEPVDLICGGFPCTDISNAGKRAGIEGEQSGLWRDMHRIICVVRPRYVVVENVSALLVRGIDIVLRDLAESGFDAEWDVLGACAFGAPMHRERIWILAYPNNTRLQGTIWAGKPTTPRAEWSSTHRKSLRSDCRYWPPGPRAVCDIPRMVDGPTYRLDRLRGLGNAVVPQVAEWIGRRIVEYEGAQ